MLCTLTLTLRWRSLKQDAKRTWGIAVDARVGDEHEPGDEESGVVDAGEPQKGRISGQHFEALIVAISGFPSQPCLMHLE